MARRSRPSKTRVIVAAAALAVCAPSTSWAQPARPAQGTGIDYNAVFEKGLDAFDAGNTVAAIEIWERLLATLGEERGYKVCYNLGLAYQKLGDATHAIERMESFANRAAKDDERQKDALERVRAMKASLGALHVAASPEGQVALVRVGAAEARPAGFLVYLAPGEHEVELYTGTARARRVRVTLVAGMTKELALEAATPAKDNATTLRPGPSPAPAAETSSFPTAWLMGGLAVTVASCALPIAFGLDAGSKRNDALALGPGSAGYADATQRFDDARTRYQVSWAIPGALALATTVVVLVLVISDRRHGDRAWGTKWTRATF